MAGNKSDGTVDNLSFEDFDFEQDLPANGFGDDGAFELEDMPVAAKPVVEPPRGGRTVLAKPVEDEFEDDVLDDNATTSSFGNGDFGNGDFEDDFPDVQDPVPVVARRRPVTAAAHNSDADAFGDENESLADDDRHVDYGDRDERGDTSRHDLAEDEIDEPVYVENNRSGSGLMKYGVYAGAGVVLLLLLFVGYSTVLPMFIGTTDSSPAPVVTSTIDDIPSATAPTLPGPILSGTSAPSFPEADAPALPGAGIPTPPEAGNSTLAPDFTPQPVIQPDLPPLDNNVIEAPTFDANPQPTPTGLGLTPSPVVADSGEVSERIERIESELDVLSRAELVEKVASLENRLAALESRPAADTPAPMVSPPAKPQVIEDWALKGVQGGVAWIEGPTGFLEVRAGSDIPGVGKVEEVTTYENSWLVVTTAGVIMQN